jgi:hypothetical protein
VTFDEAVDAALSRAVDYGADFPSARSVMFRRIGTRQQKLFIRAAALNPDYFGSDASGPLDVNRALDLKDLIGQATVDAAVAIQRIEVADPGTHATLLAGDRVSMVSIDDVNAGTIPRVTVRDFVIRAVGTDLDLVTSLCVYFPRVPDLVTSLTGTEAVAVTSQHEELLVIDLVRWLIKMTIEMDPQRKAGAVAVYDAEEQELLADFDQEIRQYGLGQSRRFSTPPINPAR